MLSEFKELSDKIERLAELAVSLRRENAQLRQANAHLASENEAFMQRLTQAQQRVEALLANIGADDDEATAP